MKTLVVFWSDLAQRLPVGNSLTEQARRKEVFDSIDAADGKGILHQAIVTRALYRRLPTISGITDTRQLLNHAFRNVVSIIQPVAAIGVDNVDRNQFRVLMIYITYYIKIWELFFQHPLEVKGCVSYAEFEGALKDLKELGIKEAEVWDDNPESAFAGLSKGAMSMPIEEFIHRCLAGALVHLSAEGEEVERTMAARLLSRTHPHLLGKLAEQPKAKGALIAYAGSAPPIPPLGQRLPPDLARGIVRDGTVNNVESAKRWMTQYMCDFESPSALQSKAPSAAMSLAPSRAAHSQARTPRVATPSGAECRFEQARGLTQVGTNNTYQMCKSQLLLSPSAAAASQAFAARSAGAAAVSQAARPLPAQHFGEGTSFPCAQASSIQKSKSLPAIAEANTTFSGLDREELRAKLEKHLEMSSTMHMRKLLKVAGGMVMSPSAQQVGERRATRARFQFDG